MTVCNRISCPHTVPLTVCNHISCLHTIPLTLCNHISCLHTVPLTVCNRISCPHRMASLHWQWLCSRGMTRWCHCSWRMTPRARCVSRPCTSPPARTTPRQRPCSCRTTTMQTWSPRCARLSPPSCNTCQRLYVPFAFCFVFLLFVFKLGGAGKKCRLSVRGWSVMYQFPHSVHELKSLLKAFFVNSSIMTSFPGNNCFYRNAQFA